MDVKETLDNLFQKDDDRNACTLMDEALLILERVAPTEQLKAASGALLSCRKARRVLEKLLSYADPNNAQAVEVLRSEKAILDRFITEATAFINDYPLPEKPEKSENENENENENEKED